MKVKKRSRKTKKRSKTNKRSFKLKKIYDGGDDDKIIFFDFDETLIDIHSDESVESMSKYELIEKLWKDSKKYSLIYDLLQKLKSNGYIFYIISMGDKKYIKNVIDNLFNDLFKDIYGYYECKNQYINNLNREEKQKFKKRYTSANDSEFYAEYKQKTIQEIIKENKNKKNIYFLDDDIKNINIIKSILGKNAINIDKKNNIISVLEKIIDEPLYVSGLQKSLTKRMRSESSSDDKTRRPKKLIMSTTPSRSPIPPKKLIMSSTPSPTKLFMSSTPFRSPKPPKKFFMSTTPSPKTPSPPKTILSKKSSPKTPLILPKKIFR